MTLKKESSFMKKVKNRKFAIDNSWKNDLVQQEKARSVKCMTEQDENTKWDLLNDNLVEADMSKYYDDRFPIVSNRKYFRKTVVFVKRAIRKLIKHILGWYIYPFYQKFSFFAGKMVNVVGLEREILYSQREMIRQSQNKIEELEKKLDELNEKLNLLSKEVTEKDNYLYSEIVFARQDNEQAKEKLNEKLNEVTLKEADGFEDIKKQLDKLQEVDSSLKKAVNRTNERIDFAETELENNVEGLHDVVQRLDELREVSVKNTIEINNAKSIVEAHELYIAHEKWKATDDFYQGLEECFRGERAVIKQRQEQYVPILKERFADWSQCTFVDIGSGRGEWLDILRENGAVDYVGVDINECQNQISRGHGHKIINKNCVEYLSELKDNSVDVISGFQIIEHLSMKELLEVFQQCYRVLKQGGMILFETPNPQNVEVGANTFYLDPTHVKPLNSLYIQYIAKCSGFDSSQIIYSASNFSYDEIREEDKKIFSEFLTDRVLGTVNMLYGPKDYCILAVKE